VDGQAIELRLFHLLERVIDIPVGKGLEVAASGEAHHERLIKLLARVPQLDVVHTGLHIGDAYLERPEGLVEIQERRLHEAHDLLNLIELLIEYPAPHVDLACVGLLLECELAQRPFHDLEDHRVLDTYAGRA